MTVRWPDSFPKPLLNGYSIKPEQTVVRTSMETGLARQRQRFSSVSTMANVRWLMNNETVALFEAWYKYKAHSGAEWIIMTLNNGLGPIDSEARFTKPYSAKSVSDTLWRVTAELEVRDMTTLSEAQLDLIIAPVSILTNSKELHELIHRDLSNNLRW